MALKYLMDENIDPIYPTQIRSKQVELILIAECSFANEYQDQIIHLPITKEV